MTAAQSEGASDESLLKVCRLLNESGARYLIAGGFAVILHEVPRFTHDVDLLIEDTEDNFRRVIEALSRLADGAAKSLTPDDFREHLIVKIADEVEVDVSRKAWVVTYEEAWPNALRDVVDGVEIPYLGLHDLIRSKQTYRDKDQLDLQLLAARSPEALAIVSAQQTNGKGCRGFLPVLGLGILVVILLGLASLATSINFAP